MKDFKSAVIFDGIADALKNDGANLIQKVKGIFGFKVKGPNGNEVLWIVDAKNGSGKVEVNGKGTHVIQGLPPKIPNEKGNFLLVNPVQYYTYSGLFAKIRRNVITLSNFLLFR